MNCIIVLFFLFLFLDKFKILIFYIYFVKQKEHLEKQLDAMRKQSNGGKKKKDSSNLSILRQR